jgi:hypothetical protein
MLDLESQEAVEHQWGWNEKDECDKKTCSEWQGKFCQPMITLGQGACAGLFIVGGQMSYYNTLKVLNYLLRQ